MTHQLQRPVELTYGATRAIQRLTGATDAIRSVIMHEVPDRQARSAALALIANALGVAVRG
jgi:hypothetical protein